MASQPAKATIDNSSRQVDKHSSNSTKRTLSGIPENYLSGNRERPKISPITSLGIQTKLRIGPTNDKYEQEADRVAEQVLRMPDPMLKRQCMGCSDTYTPSPGNEEKSQIQRLANGKVGTGEVASDFMSNLGAGVPLDAASRNYFEPRFGHDFSKVCIHNGPLANRAAASIQARAFTLGRDVVFAAREHELESEGGKRLLAHELTHVVQQQKTSKSIQRMPSLIESDIDEITTQVRNAIDRWGTDEEAVYAALQRLERDSNAIKKADAVYSKKYGTTLEDDIRGDFSEEELQYALELIGITPPVINELIQPTPSYASDYDSYARKLYNAMDIWGTNEEAIYGVLIAMENVPERVDRLKAAYTNKYPAGLHGGDLEYDIRAEMSDEELDYALLLLNVIPLGNTAILTWIRGLIAKPVKKEIAAEVMKSLNQITDDRLTVIIVDLIRVFKIASFKSNLVSVVAGDFSALVDRIGSIEAKFSDPSVGTTASTTDQKSKITGILNQGMAVDVTTGNIAAFDNIVAGRSYNQDIQETLEREVTILTPRAVNRSALPKFGWPRYEEMANEAKTRTDAVFGHYTMGLALTAAVGPGRNLFDFSQQAFSDAQLLHFANYLVTGHNAHDPIYPGRDIHQVHTADIERIDEKDKIKTALATWFGLPGNKTRLLKVLQNWSGAQSGGNIFMQRWDVGDVNKNRKQFWKMFQTMIHEYLHKITHANYSTKAAALGRAKEQVYTEGGTSYFDERVWKTLYPEEVRANPNLREKVEGGIYPYDSSLMPTNTGYAQIDQFKQIVNVVGEPNASAAYFLGKTDSIGL